MGPLVHEVWLGPSEIQGRGAPTALSVREVSKALGETPGRRGRRDNPGHLVNRVQSVLLDSLGLQGLLGLKDLSEYRAL